MHSIYIQYKSINKLSKAGAALVDTISSIEEDWRREKDINDLPENGHGRPALVGSTSLSRALSLVQILSSSVP